MAMFKAAKKKAVWSIFLVAGILLVPSPREGTANAEKPNYFANHRVLKFHRVDDFPRGGTMFINGSKVILQVNTGVFWFGAFLGLYTYDEHLDQWTNFSTQKEEKFFKSVRLLCEDKAGKVWLKSNHAGMKYFDGTSWHDADETIPPASIAGCQIMFTGKDALLWFVTDAGLISYDGKKWSPLVPIPENVKEEYTKIPIKYRTKQEEERAAFFTRIDKKTLSNSNELKTNTPKASSLIYETSTGLQDQDGFIWLGTRKAIINYDPKGGIWKIYSLHGLTEATIIYKDRQGRIWFGDKQGHLTIYDKKKGDWISHSLSTYFPQIQPKLINSIYQDKAGQIMIGTDEGVVLFNEAGNRWRIIDDRNDFSPVYSATTIFEDKRGRIWISISEGVLVLE